LEPVAVKSDPKKKEQMVALATQLLK